jgi:serine/threonine protein kinase
VSGKGIRAHVNSLVLIICIRTISTVKAFFDQSEVHSLGTFYGMEEPRLFKSETSPFMDGERQDQDSGNICFGVEKGDKRYFIKFAGAPTEQYSGKPDEGIARLKSTVSIYKNLAHPNLLRFIKAEEIGGGFAAIFEWTDGECMGRMYPKSRKKFLQMPYSTRLEVFNDILAFHIHVIKQGYVAIDFYDGSIMYDFDTEKTLICDIDLYSKMPYTNAMGRMWGSSRFMSPEEFMLGETIDEITTVYLMGAIAFALFGRETDRSIEKWRLGDKLYKVALQAVNDNRDKRQQSLTEFEEEWNRACCLI